MNKLFPIVLALLFFCCDDTPKKEIIKEVDSQPKDSQPSSKINSESKNNILSDSYSEIAYNAIENEFGNFLYPNTNKKILLSFDYSPSSSAELNPGAIAIMKQILLTGNKVYSMALWPAGIDIYEDVKEQVLNDPQIIEYNRTNANVEENIIALGYAPGGGIVIKYMLENMSVVFPDSNLDIENLCDYNFIVSFSAGFPGSIDWVQYGADPSRFDCDNEVSITTGVTAVLAPDIVPYVNSGQVKGMLIGLSGAANYQKLSEIIDE